MRIVTQIAIVIGLLAGVASSTAQDFYALDQIQRIEITMAQTNWDQILDAAYPSGDYTLAQEVAINGVVFDSVGVKYKGNSSYQANQAKNPWHIELDTYKDHIYDGYTDIKLSNVAKDPSFVREVLSYYVLRQYMDAPLSNYATVHVNGELIGLYSNSESISKKFVNKRFGSKGNTFVKCSPPDGAGPQSRDFPDLRYLGSDSTAYYDAYELKSDSGWGALIDLCDTLSNHTESIEHILDVDRALWMLAFDNVLVNLDSYIGAFKQNYYLYRGDYGRFLPVVWDLNESFGSFSMTGTGNLNSTTAKQQMDPLLHADDSDFPLMQQLMAIPQYRRRYLAHYKTMLLENFDNETYYQVATQLRATIDEAVQQDGNKFFTYANFLSNLDSDVNSGGGPGGGATPGIASLMDGRTEYLLALPLFTATAPEISAIEAAPTQAVVGAMVTITANVQGATEVYLHYRSAEHAPFVQTIMYDDGAHGDELANDGIYGAELTVDAVTTEYYIYADNDDAGRFSPARAEHEFYTLSATSPVTPAGDLVINEFMASNDVTQADQDGDYDDWIELYNNSNAEIDLSGYLLSDDIMEADKWVIPAGTTIAAGDYLIIWADEDDDQEGLHADFKLSAGGEDVIISTPDGQTVDQVTYPEQTTDVSYGRIPNGTGAFELMQPTFNGENQVISSTTNLSAINNQIAVLPNPASNSFRIHAADPSILGQRATIYNIDGRVVQQMTITEYSVIDISAWQSGLYTVRVGSSTTRLIKL